MTYVYDIFISYSSKDAEWVRGWLLCKLEDAGFHVCIDHRDFVIGSPSLINMEDGVRKSAKTILVLTPNYIKSEWTAFESLLIQTDDPIGQNRRLIPIKLVDCEPPSRIRIFTFADFRNQTQWIDQFKRLIRDLRNEISTSCIIPNEDKNLENEVWIKKGGDNVMIGVKITGEYNGIKVEAFIANPTPDILKELTNLIKEIKYCSKDETAKSQNLFLGSLIIQLTLTNEGYYRLSRLYTTGAIKKYLHADVELLSLVASNNIEIHNIVSGKKKFDYKNLKNTLQSIYGFCPKDKIVSDGYDYETPYKAANGLLPPPTNKMNNVAIYITSVKDTYYFHSNYRPENAPYAFKSSINTKQSIFEIVSNLLTANSQISIGLTELKNHHQNNILYFISEKIFLDKNNCELNLDGAKKIRIVNEN